MSATSLPVVRRRMYEIFRIIHIGCSTSICVLLWLHAFKVSKTGRVQVIMGTCMWAATWIHRSALLVYRNFSVSQPHTSIIVENIHNSLQVKVKLPRPWKIKPGQYVYLTTLRPGFFSIFQRHPFMVIGSESESYNFQLFIQPRMGFTNRMLMQTLGGTPELSALIEGPYGHGFDLRDFGTVVLFASGIGIAGHLAYVQSLIYDYRKLKTKTRDLLLVWHVDNKYQLDLVWGVMNHILRRDDLPVATNHDTRTQWENGKRGRDLGSNVTSESPGVRPIPHGENASVTARRSEVV